MKRILALIFIIAVSLNAVTVTMEKNEYASNENLQLTLSDMPDPLNDGDWVGIFSKNATSEWANVMSWKHDGAVNNGTYTLRGVPAGTYEARVFLNNSYTLLTKVEFNVEDVVHNTTITTSAATYNSAMPITVTVANMPAPLNDGDWIGIFPKDAASEWANIVSWKHDGEVNNGTYILAGIAAGTYEARVFLNNSYTLLAKKEFTVNDVQFDTTVTTSQAQYETGDLINITLANMPEPENDGDWVAIFDKDSENLWENARAWKHDGAVNNGTYDLRSLPAGEYEVRVFLNNSWTQIAQSSFTVIEKVIITTVETNKQTYVNGENIVVTATNMMANQRDWIGIFPVGAANEFEKAYDWRWTNGFQHGSITFAALPAGEYEIRVFFNDGFDPKATTSITVTHVGKPTTVIDDAENGISDGWVQIQGQYPAKRAPVGYESTGTLVLSPEWRQVDGNWLNPVEYHHTMNNSTQPILKMDIGGLPEYSYRAGMTKGYMPHFFVGVYVRTQKGNRVMIWDSFFNHEGLDPHIADYGNGNVWMHYPSPVEHVRGWFEETHVWTHFMVDIEQQLKILEPDNNLVYIEKFIATGGFLDNITLSDR